MKPTWLLTYLTAAACGGAPAHVPAPSTTASATAPGAACEPPPDGAESRGPFALAMGYNKVRLYRVDQDRCAELIATIDTDGPSAFASIGEAKPGEMPELFIETWLMHGDRRSQRYVWFGDHYEETGRAEEIPGLQR